MTTRPASAPDPDRERTARLRAGDASALEAIFREYYARLCGYADRIVHAPDVAEEIVQDVFANLWRSRHSIAVTTTLRGYLFGAVRNRALNHLRRAAPEVTLTETAGGAVAHGGRRGLDPARDLEINETAARVREAVDSLPPRCREVVLLRWIHGLRHAEIAHTLGISVKAVENHLTRGIRTLRELLAGPAD